MRKIYLTPEKATYIALISAFAFITAVVSLILVPSLIKTRELKNQIESMRIALEERYQQAQKLRKNIVKLDEIRKEAGKFQNALMKEGGELEILHFLENLAQNSGVSIKISPKSLEQKNSALRYGISLEIFLSGEFKNIMEFAHALDQSDYYIALSEMKIQKANSEKAEGTLFAKIFGAAFYGK